MKISAAVLNYYLSTLTMDWFAGHSLPPRDLAGYDEAIDNLARYAAERDDLEPLRAAIEHVLGNPEVDARWYVTSEYPFQQEYIRDLFRHVRTRLWPDAGPLPEGGRPDVELENTGIEDWWRKRGLLDLRVRG
jgi:hypothetical protein